MSPRTFELVRHRDLSGVSGTGVVAEGCVFTDGSVALRWRGNNPATAVWPDLDSVLAVHGHHGATEVHWLEDWTESHPPLDPPELHPRRPLGQRGARPLEEFHSASSLGGTAPSEAGSASPASQTDSWSPPGAGDRWSPTSPGDSWTPPSKTGSWSPPVEDESGTEDEDRAALDQLFGVQHAIRPPTPGADPGGHARGWAGARHLR
ncbi:hypothetical protein [Kribbella sp. ALI-6-A]|uniref:hypothetical protein n=1 Tax=Kribbella sp. ALI-6-A TaxID=1933817 RepID=UPI001EDBF685|nr:hypothetical protein [Kribbella sp. ALI-6-A]